MRFPAVLCLLLVVTSAAGLPRSSSAKREFRREHPCPAAEAKRGACPGYVIDHIWPLACGGEDHPRNMQWQTVGDGKAKDRWERKVCGKAD